MLEPVHNMNEKRKGFVQQDYKRYLERPVTTEADATFFNDEIADCC